MRAQLKDIAFTRTGETILTIATREQCQDLFDELHGADVSVTIKKYRVKRSLDANAYFWALLDKLAEKTQIPKEDLYKNFIRNIGGNSSVVCVQDVAVSKLREAWSKNGLGWFSETLPSKIEGCTNVLLYYGSSTYDSAQMNRLINLTVDSCKEQGVETMPPSELNSLLEAWE